MSVRFALIVEGHGDASAIPTILRRLCAELGVYELSKPSVVREKRNRVVKPGEWERAIEFSSRKLLGQGWSTGDPGGILAVLDADDDDWRELKSDLEARARKCRPDIPCVVAIANREKEAWFLAAIESLRGFRGVPADAVSLPDPEGPRSAKGALEQVTRLPFSEVDDQPAFAARFDLSLARKGSPSFDDFCREVEGLLGPQTAGSVT